MLVSICIITYQRPEGLSRTLKSIDLLRFDKIPTPEIEVIVIDNDAAGLAGKICAEIQPEFKWQLIFGIEPQKGISYARNRSIAMTAARSEFIVTIDDDEVAEPQWLEQLLMVQKYYDADVVSGPVVPYFPDPDVPEWVKTGKFFDPPSYETGTQIDVAFAGNVLIRAEIIRKLDKVFDERFALTGGEDSDLFMRLYRSGCKMIWSNEAIVAEWVPNTRTNRQYILQRGYRAWSSYSLLERELYPSFKTQGMRIIKGLGLISIGILTLIPALFQGQQAIVIAMRSIYRGCGTIAGLLGKNYEEYK
jgi:succinoglycan biosynthesis protein ExoM